METDKNFLPSPKLSIDACRCLFEAVSGCYITGVLQVSQLFAGGLERATWQSVLKGTETVDKKIDAHNKYRIFHSP